VQDLDAVWAARVSHVLEGRPDSDRSALELAAALGVEVDAAEWRGACVIAGVAPAPDLVDAMLDAELAVAGDEGSSVLWSFAHGGLRERLEHQAREGDGRRWARWNAAIAELLAPRGALTAGRRGQHLLAAGHHDEAIDALLDGASFLIARGDLRAELLLDQAEAALAELDDPGDRRQGELLVHRSHVARFLLDAEQLQRLGDQAIAQAQARGWPDLEARGHLAHGEAARVRTDPEGALVHLRRAEALARTHALPRILLEALELSAVMHLSQGRVEPAEAAGREALALCPDHGDPRTEAFARIGLSSMLLMQDRLDEAWEHNEAARRLFERLHNWEMLAQVLNLEGELLRARGDLTGARRAYEEAIDVLRLQSGDDGSVRFVELNVALILIEEGKYREAEPRLWTLLGRFNDDDRTSSPVAAAWCQAALLPCLAATGRWPDFDQCLHELIEAIARHQLAERDLARCAARAGGQARRAGHPERARTCWELSRTQYHQLGNTEEEQRIAAALGALPAPH
jgi:tetratricopeptide (TPR) repeat protein